MCDGGPTVLAAQDREYLTHVAAGIRALETRLEIVEGASRARYGGVLQYVQRYTKTSSKVRPLTPLDDSGQTR